MTFYVNHIGRGNEQVPIIVTGGEEYYPIFLNRTDHRRLVSIGNRFYLISTFPLVRGQVDP